ncbi:MAG TPA: hypothetical protein VEC06_10975 [Paucimonas sp.]|nr:hypothetical protein [Paucimonas sp.]
MQALAGFADMEIQGRRGEWRKLARDNQWVTVRWDGEEDSSVARIALSSDHVPEPAHFSLSLDGGFPSSHTQRLGTIDVTLELGADVFGLGSESIALICNLPLTENSFFNGPIGVWPVEPDVPVVPDDPRLPDDPAEIDIEGPQHAVDLFPFVWLHPPGVRELAGIDRRFVSLESLGLAPGQLDFYNQLAAETGAGAATAKQADAASFIQHGYQQAKFVAALSDLPSPIDEFPAWRAALERIPGTIPEDELIEMATFFLGQPPGSFLDGSVWNTAQADVWQSLFALALAGQPDDARLAVQLTDVLRVGHFLQLLVAGRHDDLGEHAARRIVLGARPIFPDAVAAYPPSPAIAGPAGGSAAGGWEVLGVGNLKIARQRLAAYLPGEIAEIVNVMPRERQEVQEHIATGMAGHAGSSGEKASQDSLSRLSSVANELSDAVQEAMAAEGALNNLSNVQPAYNNLNLTLSGAAAGGEAGSRWNGEGAARYLQSLTEHAARRLGERVSDQRSAVWQEFRERRQSTLIDNAGSGRLVGIYRWVDRVMRVHLEEAGRRMVLAFEIAQPAKPWLDKIAAAGPVPLRQPAPLEIFGVPDGQGYTGITAANYQSFGAQYGLRAMEPPPPASVVVAASFDRTSTADMAGLRIPDGYAAASGQVTIALADNRYNLVCSIGGQPYSGPAAAATAVKLDTAVPASTSDAGAIGDAVVTVPQVPTSALSCAPLTAATLAQLPQDGGPVPVTVMTAAPAFVVKVELSCQRSGDAGTDQGMIAWQVRTYERLLQAYQEACLTYDAQLAARTEAASAGRSGEVQRNTLRQACLQLLAPAGGTLDSGMLDPLLSWDAMTWHYESWQAGKPGAWPEPVAAGVTRPSSERLFACFLKAASARVLLPVNPGWEGWMLFLLMFGRPWVGGPASVPVIGASVLLLEEIREPECVRVVGASGELVCIPDLPNDIPPPSWTVRIPTSMLYLQGDASLPAFPASLSC